jgi:SpoVK/Ycf46/Vps4 family AAA+-type ATPase
MLGLDYMIENREVVIDDFQKSSHVIITLNGIDQLPSMVVPSCCDVQSESRKLVLEPISIEEVGVGDYYGFELDKNGRFLLKDGFVTHNTTIAKIIGELYQQMGILSANGVFKIAKREDFVAEYLGQSAIKTRKLLESCLGGVLFIDEVYALGPGDNDKDSFSKEAIDTLNLFLSENSQSFCCIIAGYEEDVRKCFLNVNKGLERRFQWVHKIENYSVAELVEIFFKLMAEIGWETEVSSTFVKQVITNDINHFKHFGGDIENLITKCKMSHAKRIFSEKNPKRFLITEKDIINAIEIIKTNSFKIETSLTHLSMYN